MNEPKVYLAGPGVFRPNAAALGRQLKALCAAQGLHGLWPGDNPANGGRPLHQAQALFDANRDMIRQACALVADVTPFRGPHCDPGTAWEIGYAHALGLPVFGYVLPHPGQGTGLQMVTVPIERIWCERKADGWRDAQGDLVEDFGLFDNLMVALAVRPMIARCAEIAISRAAGALLRAGA